MEERKKNRKTDETVVKETKLIEAKILPGPISNLSKGSSSKSDKKDKDREREV